VRKVVIALVVVAVAGRSCGTCGDDGPSPALRIATFNIEDFPKGEAQIAGAFAEIVAVGAPVIALQEITDPEVFEREAKARLGDRWRFVYEEAIPDHHRMGVLYDGMAYRHIATRVHDGTRLAGRRHKGVLEVELARGNQHVRVLVVHLAASSEQQPVRHQQHAALQQIVAQVVRSGAQVVVLGDFNATDDDRDRADLAALASATGMTWATEDLACSAFWRRSDGCPRSRLDHVLSTEAAREVRNAGACAVDGCEWQDRCPLYAEQVSDHCPVVVDF